MFVTEVALQRVVVLLQDAAAAAGGGALVAWDVESQSESRL